MAVDHVEVISREMIKPSSPTPQHLRNLNISFLDQIAPPVYIPLIFFYDQYIPEDNSDDRAQKSQSLKQSLSDTLTQFYPLAGRLENNTSVECNDAGVEYVEAQVHGPISQVIQKPDMDDLKNYLPVEACGPGVGMGRERVLLAVQLNFFAGGGMAIGVCISHKIADGSSLATFISAWAAISLGTVNTAKPSFDLACQFPPRDLSGFAPTSGITKQKIVTRRLVFDKTKLATLKEAASSASEVKDPTRVEAVSAFILRQVMEATKLKSESKKTFAAVHAVNLRSRMCPPLPDHAFGNVWRVAIALISNQVDEEGCDDLSAQLRRAIRKINGDYVKKLQDSDGQSELEYMKRAGEQHRKGDMEFCSFSSWCRFPVYEVDFGWGVPAWVCTVTLPFKNVVILMSSRCGQGMEAWVNMAEDDMALLHEHPKDLLVSHDTTEIRD